MKTVSKALTNLLQDLCMYGQCQCGVPYKSGMSCKAGIYKKFSCTLQANVGIRQASCISGLVHDTEAQATQLKCKADKLYQQLISSRMEVAWLRTRVHQLQQSQFVRSSEAAREVAGLSAQHCAQRFPLEHLRNCSNF